MAIFFRGATKIGFLYEGNMLSDEVVFKVYKDVPKSYNDLAQWAEMMKEKVDVLVETKGRYVFLNDREIMDINHLKLLKQAKK